MDAGYTATDYVMGNIVQNKRECRWLTVTNADNIYGSDVIHRIRASLSDVDLLIFPTNSRNFINAGSQCFCVIPSHS